MVKIGLQICATLENVEELRTSHPDYPFFIKVKCSNCGEESDKWHDLTGKCSETPHLSLSLLTLILPCPESEKVNEDSRNPEGFNFYAKCKLCNRENSMDIIPGTNAVYTSDDTGKLKTIVQFDCRGLEPTAFSPRTGWLVKSADGGPSFTDVDLSEDDWVEYDTKNDVPVAVYEFKSEFVKLKK